MYPSFWSKRAGHPIGQRNFSSPDLRLSLPLPGAAFFLRARRTTPGIPRMREMKLQDLKSKSPTELLAFAEEHAVENASTMRKQEQMFAILKQLAAKEIDIIGEGVVEVLSD